jgi:hypothetical protein
VPFQLAGARFPQRNRAATTTAVVGLGVQRRLFTTDHRLVAPARTER